MTSGSPTLHPRLRISQTLRHLNQKPVGTPAIPLLPPPRLLSQSRKKAGTVTCSPIFRNPLVHKYNKVKNVKNRVIICIIQLIFLEYKLPIVLINISLFPHSVITLEYILLAPELYQILFTHWFLSIQSFNFRPTYFLIQISLQRQRKEAWQNVNGRRNCRADTVVDYGGRHHSPWSSSWGKSCITYRDN